MSMRKRLISIVLAAAIMLSLLPTTAQAAADSLTVVINGSAVVEDGQLQDGLPAGVSYSELTRTLTLNNASLESLFIHGGSMVIALRGDSTIRGGGLVPPDSKDPGAPFSVSYGTLTVKGPGSLTVDSTVTGAHAFSSNNSDITFTDRAVLTFRSDFGEECWSAFDVVASSLRVEGGVSLTIWGQYGLSLGYDKLSPGTGGSSFCELTDCAVTLSHLMIGPDASTVTVGRGAELRLTSAPEAENSLRGRVLTVGEGGRFIVDGGQVTVDTTAAPEGEDGAVGISGNGSRFELRQGSFDVPHSASGFQVADGASLIQSGGVLNVSVQENQAQALDVDGGEVALTGGAASLSGWWGVTIGEEGAFTVNGGQAELLGWGGDGLTVKMAGVFSLLSGQVSLESSSADSLPLRCTSGGHVNLLGGRLHLKNNAGSSALSASGSDPITIGPNMRTVDDNTGEELALSGDSVLRYLSSSVTVSASDGVRAYAADLSIPSGEVIQGAVFNVRAVVSLGAETGTVSFSLPDGVSYVPGSLTVDAQTVTPVSTSPLTVKLEAGGTIRFSAVAAQSGSRTLTTDITAGTEKHRETLPFEVNAFRLSLPGRTTRLKLPVSGSAVPGSLVTFYEGEGILGTARTNALGTWSGTVTLPKAAGEHTVYAQIDFPEGGSVRSEEQTVVYAPDTDEVKTLSLTTWAHGRTSADPNIATTVVIDYVNWTASESYYTYWPELPTFEYKVDFVKDASAQRSVAVVTTDRMGQETRVPLRYKAAEDAWVGSHDYETEDVPYKFRVEFVPGDAQNPVDSGAYTFDDKGNLTQLMLDDGASINFSYGQGGQVTLTTEGLDLYGQGVDVTAAGTIVSGDSEVFFDSAGRIIRITSDGGVSLALAYDPRTAIDPSAENDVSEIISDDGNGNVIRIRSGYDTGDDLHIEMSLSDGSSVMYTADLSGRLTGVADGNGNYTRYQRDEAGEVISILYSDGRSESRTLDAQGRTVSYTSRSGVTATQTYDNSGNLTQVAYSTGDTLSYTYNGNGDLTGVTKNGETTRMTYDASGNLTRVTYPDGKYISYAYDAQGRLTLLADSGGYQTGYTYNDQDLLASVTDGTSTLITYSYDAAGNLTRQQNANGTYTQYSYTGGNLSSIQNYDAGGGLISSFSYTYDADGRITAMTEAGGAWRYSYGTQGQLTGAVSPDGETTRYTYDAAGNRTRVTTDGTAVRYTANELNQYTAYGDTTRTYNAEGQLVTETRDGKTARYTWNVFGELTGYTDFDGTVYEYGYDVFGLRNKVTVNGETTTYLNDPIGYGYAVASYGPGGEAHYAVTGVVSALRTGDGTYYYNANHLGSVTEITGAGGAVINRYTYDQEGAVLTRTEGVSNPYTYGGVFGLVNDGNGLVYDRVRYLSAATGSFISMDPAGQTYDLNLYRYAFGNPVRYIDISGEFGEITGIGGGGIGGGLDNWNGRQPNQGQPGNQGKPGQNAGQGQNNSRNTRPRPTKPDRAGENFDKYDYEWEPKDKDNDDDNDDDNNDDDDKKGGGGGAAAGEGAGAGDPTPGKKLNIVASVPLDPEALGKGLLIAAVVVAAIVLLPLLPWGAIGAAVGAVAGAVAAGLASAKLGSVAIGGLIMIIVPIIFYSGGKAGAEPIKTAYYSEPVLLDPSGYVYEGIPSNRLSGVTATLYYSGSETKPTSNASESQRWDATGFGQSNPLTTDAMGQYLWMVPDGWWQVKYEKPGYQTAYSDWLPVPPVQTDVNVGLVSTEAAKLTLSGEMGDDALVLRFDRPVRLSTVTADTLRFTLNGAALAGELTPLDSGTASDGRSCATTFTFRMSGGRTLRSGDQAVVQYGDVATCAGTSSSGSASVSVTDPMPFHDVNRGDYFYDAVLWAVDHDPQVTNGTNVQGTEFSPDMACTRAQVVTFLWRAMGEPETKSSASPFTDIKPGDYYYKAVLWAVEQGITNGTNAEGTTFSPDLICSRGQIVTFLYRLEKTPEPNGKTNPFRDVASTQYYYDAVLWAVELGVTNGTNTEGTAFSPDTTCTRGQIVTFLYRDMK